MSMNTPKPYSILFVCLGNIRRSPAAEIIFKAMVKEQGLKGKLKATRRHDRLPSGYPPDARMLEALKNTATVIQD